jgi:type I restriction enzyme S subunit
MKQGWEKKKLKDISYVIMGQSPSSTSYNDKEIGYPLLNGAADYKGQIFNPKKYTNAPTRLAEKNDILLGIRATIGNIAISDQTYCIGRGVAAIRVNEQKAHRNYIKNYLVSALDEIIGKSGGAIIKGIKKEDLTDMIIYLPDVNEQKRIVTKLDECFEAIDKARANVEKNLNNAKELFQSQLNEIFSQKGDGWVEKKLGEVSNIIYGYTAKAKHEPATAKYLRITDIQNSNVNWESVPYCDLDEDELDKYQLKIGDIVFARTGATTGKSFIIKNPPKAVFASYLIRVQIDNEELKPNFLYLFFQSSYYWYLINKGISGSAQGGFNASKLKKLSISFPVSPEKQIRIIKEMEELKTQTQALESNYQQELDALDELKKSILQKAFNGEL